jgi:hypothetical protein
LVDSLISIEKISVAYQPNPLFSACTCDLTGSSCDAYCCCDTECSTRLVNEWNSLSKCKNINYEALRGAPLNKCVKDQQIYEYNRKRGLNNYMDPFTKLFCVYLDNSPKMDYFYNQKSDISADEMNRITSNSDNKGFHASMFPITTSVTNQYYKQTYKIGQELFARLE